MAATALNAKTLKSQQIKFNKTHNNNKKSELFQYLGGAITITQQTTSMKSGERNFFQL